MNAAISLRARVLLTAVLMTCCGHQFAQTAEKPESSGTVIRKSVRQVIVDVVVTDSNKKPVRGLTRKDFSVSEDGSAQRILSFDVHNFDPSDSTPPLPPLPPNTFMNIAICSRAASQVSRRQTGGYALCHICPCRGTSPYSRIHRRQEPAVRRGGSEES